MSIPADCPDLSTYIRAYYLCVLGCGVFPGYPKETIYCDMVQFLEDLDQINEYAWGAAMLGHTLYAMKRYKKYGLKYFSGSGLLLQVNCEFEFEFKFLFMKKNCFIF